MLNCAHLVRASLNSLYIPLSVLPLVEISAAALNRLFTVNTGSRGVGVFKQLSLGLASTCRMSGDLCIPDFCIIFSFSLTALANYANL